MAVVGLLLGSWVVMQGVECVWKAFARGVCKCLQEVECVVQVFGRSLKQVG